MEGDTSSAITALAVAAALGGLIGLERQVARGETADPYAGVRTFALYALWGAASSFFGERFGAAAFAVGAGAFASLIVASYLVSSGRSGDWGTTTEGAALLAFAIGVLCWSGFLLEATALTVGTMVLLQAKEPLHRLSARFSSEDVRVALRFGIITAVVLPLVPGRDLGPYAAFNPRQIWLMVVLVTTIGLVGYVALRAMGPRGLALTGLLGGLVSSTAVTLSFSRSSRQRVDLRSVLTAGILAASALMYGRALVLAAVVAPALAARLVLPLLALFVFVMGAAGLRWRRAKDVPDVEAAPELRNPLTLGAAFEFAFLYAAVIFFSRLVAAELSDASVNVVGVVSGLYDVDAVTLSTANLVAGGFQAAVGAQVVMAAVSINTLVKAGFALTLGDRRLGRSVGAVLVPAAALGGLAWLLL